MSKNRLGPAAVALVPTGLTLSLLLSGCGKSLREYAVPDLNCGEDPQSITRIDYRYLQPGQVVRLGHAAFSDSGLYSDAAVTVTAEGLVTASSKKRDDIGHPPEPQIQGRSDGGVEIISGDETYTATAEAETDGSGFKLVINGHCIDPSQALAQTNAPQGAYDGL